jgi:hypothetical protein
MNHQPCFFNTNEHARYKSDFLLVAKVIIFFGLKNQKIDLYAQGSPCRENLTK